MIKDIENIIIKIKNKKILEFLNDNIELKSSWNEEHGKKISGLANKTIDSPRFLIIGLDDNGNYSKENSKWIKSALHEIENHVKQHLYPIQACKNILPIEIEKDKYILVMEIINPGIVVYWKSKAYYMNATSVSELEISDIHALNLKLPGIIDYSKQVYTGSINEELISAYQSFLIKNRKIKSNPLFNNIKDLKPIDLMRSIGIENTKDYFIY